MQLDKIPANPYRKRFLHPILSKSLMEMPFQLDPDILAQISRAILNLDFNRYPRLEVDELEGLISTWLQLPNNISIVVGNGGFDLIDTLLHMISFADNPSALIIEPDFFIFDNFCIKYDIKLHKFNRDNLWRLDVEALLKYISDTKPSLIFISNPNNPLSTTIASADLELIINSTNALVLIDETYINFADHKACNISQKIDRYNNLLILRSFSKIGVAAIRTGFIYGQKIIIDNLKKLQVPFNNNTISLEIAKIVIKNFDLIQQNIDKLITLRDDMISSLTNIDNVQIIKSSTNFIIVEFINFDTALLHRKLLENEFIVNMVFPYKQLLRFDVLDAKTNEECINFLKKLMVSL